MQETFAEYTACTSFERPLLSGVAYAERVVNSERENFERQHGWTIKTMEKEPSPPQDEYAPVIFSQETVSYIKSLDMMSSEVCVLVQVVCIVFVSSGALTLCLVFVLTLGFGPVCAGRQGEHLEVYGNGRVCSSKMNGFL